MAKDKTLTGEQEQTVRELFAAGRSREELAVGFGVSYNTIRNILGHRNGRSEASDDAKGDAA